ncbi:MAG: formylglycine-generating enzyme family protein [Planctomycetota bacterium]|jgi:formylglycine-generating enzyme required for sulfatase activity
MYVRSAAAFLLAATIFPTALARAEATTPPWAKVSPEQVAAAKKLGVPVAFENSVGMRFVLIPPGTFMMGSRDPAAEVARRCAMPNAQSGWFYDEHPRHKVTLTKAVYMAIHEVTQGCYEAVTGPKSAKDTKKKKGKKEKNADEYPEEFKGADKPVGNVAWSDAEKFCKTLSRNKAEEGRKYALPTEAQWEYACRAASTTPFAFGETASTDKANYHGGYTYGGGTKGENRAKPLPVGSLPANAWGLHDMHGNVSEWCADWYVEYAGAAASDPQGPAKGKQRVLRGGSWRSYPGACRSAFRHRGEGRARSYNTGFRVCCAVPAESDKGK